MSVKFSLSSGPHRISDAQIYFSFVHQNHGILLNVDYRPCVLHKRIRCFHWSSRKFNTLTPSLPNMPTESGSDVTRSFSAPASQPDINRDLFSTLIGVIGSSVLLNRRVDLGGIDISNASFAGLIGGLYFYYRWYPWLFLCSTIVGGLQLHYFVNSDSYNKGCSMGSCKVDRKLEGQESFGDQHRIAGCSSWS